MNSPTVSVVLPVFNGERYISAAIGSIVTQTFHDFELVVVNDGSTDTTESIVRKFSDPRIVYVKNEKNAGLIYTLNKGIEAARGKYIARMDSDDISLPDRLHQQYEFLEQHPDIGIVATTIINIDENDHQLGAWELDRKTLSDNTIRSTMLKENCISHPSVMGKAELFHAFPYQALQKNVEDYDLWLRLLANNIRFAKIANPLLLYRVHPASVTSVKLKNKNFYFKHFQMKRRLLVSLKKINAYALKILLSALSDLAFGIGKSIKSAFRN